MEKDFDNWHGFKKTLQIDTTIRNFSQREIWWTSIGINIGHEQDGKGKAFNRPVLIVKKFNKQLFWGVPLTTQVKENPHYHYFELNNKPQCAMLTHLRLYDTHRLGNRMSRLPSDQFQIICEKLRAYLV